MIEELTTQELEEMLRDDLIERLEGYMEYRTGDCRHCPLAKHGACQFDADTASIDAHDCRDQQIEFIIGNWPGLTDKVVHPNKIYFMKLLIRYLVRSGGPESLDIVRAFGAWMRNDVGVRLSDWFEWVLSKAEARLISCREQ